MGYLTFVKENLSHVLPLFLAAGFAIAIVIERIKTLYQVYPMKNGNAFFEKLRDLILTGKTSDALSLCDQYSEKPAAKVTKSALLRAHLPENLIEHGIEMSVNEVSHAIQKRTAFLATIANVATLLGLFGTILGLIHSFEAVGHADAQQKSALLSAGIATAMNATMTGLGIAIPCMVAFSFLMNRANELTAEIENAGIRVLDLLKQRYYAADLKQIEETEEVPNGKANDRRVA